MQAAPKLQQIVSRLAEKHHVNLDNAGAYLRLLLPEHGQLVIENIGASRISVANYVQVHRNWVADPAIVVFVVHSRPQNDGEQQEHTWFPIEVNELFGGWRLYAEPDQRGNLALYDPTGQAELAALAEHQVARNLDEFGWLEHGAPVSAPIVPWTPDEIRSRDIRTEEILAVASHDQWPEPTVAPPDLETLEAWMFDDGDCEATDGCFVEPDGRCPHGHPSWLLKMGLI